MVSHALRLFVLMLACCYVFSSTAIPMSRLSNLPNNNRRGFVATSNMKQDHQIISEDKMEESSIEGRMDFEKNDYGPTTSNPIHTPRPPR